MILRTKLRLAMGRRIQSRGTLCFLLLLAVTSLAVSEETPSKNEQKKEVVPSTDDADGEALTADDIPADGKCAEEVSKFCKDKKEGRSELADCIYERLDRDKSLADADKVVSGECKDELHKFLAARAADIRLDKKLMDACEDDIKACLDSKIFEWDDGDELSCLRAEKEKLSEKCKAQVVRTELMAAQDFELDAVLFRFCRQDAKDYCDGVDHSNGGIQSCLREKGPKVSFACRTELFRQETENVDDIRLNARLYRACVIDQRKFCKDVLPGDARVKDCLEENRENPDFSPRCKAEFDKMMEARSKDFRLDANLRKFCHKDILMTCYQTLDDDAPDTAKDDGNVTRCLQDYREELVNPDCKREVHRLTERAAKEMRFDPVLSALCKEDRESVCRDVEDEEGKVFHCLQEKREELKLKCRKAVFEQEMILATSIDFKTPLKLACSDEIGKLCKDAKLGETASVIKCLQEHVNDDEMGEACQNEVRFDEMQAAQDYRLNYRLKMACAKDVKRLKCMEKCDERAVSNEEGYMCGGTVLECLQTHMEKLNKTCADEVFFYEKKETQDIRLDVPLQRACKGDLAELCRKVPMDDAGRPADHITTLRCLRSHRNKLSKECREEENHFSMMEASDIRLVPTLMNACQEELQVYCPKLSTANGEAFKCLQEKLEEPGMGQHCRAEVILQELRHASNYKLDVRVRKECAEDVTKLCADVDASAEGHAEVLTCFVKKIKQLSPGCKSEVSYAVRMALWQYKMGEALTGPCDAEVNKRCRRKGKGTEVVEEDGVVLGVYGQCLLQLRPSALVKDCGDLTRAVTAVNSHSFAETMAKVEELDRFRPRFVITGWLALVASTALFVVVILGAYGVYRFYNPAPSYQLVLKGENMPTTKLGDV